MKTKVKSWLKSYFNTFLETLPLLGLIFILNPLLIIFSIPEPYSFGFSFFLLGVFAVCLGLLIALPISFFSVKYRDISISLFRSLFLVFFVVTIFYPEGGHKLDGTSVDSESYEYYFLVYSVYALSVVSLMFLFLRKTVLFRNFYLISAFCMLAFTIYYPIQELVTAKREFAVYSDNTELTFASDKNIIVILADMLQGSTLEQYLMMHPEEKNALEGFTLFSRATSPFPFTSFGAPAIMTGSVYNSGSKADAYQQVSGAQNSSFLTDAEECGFDSMALGLESVFLHKNQFVYNSCNPAEVASILLSLSIERIGKISLDTYGLNSNMWVIGFKKTSSDIMSRLSKSPIGTSKNKILFFHNMIPHAPIVFKREHLESMPLFVKPLSLTVENYWDEMGFFVGKVGQLIEHMKRIGVYDKSLIVITGDHGHGLGKNPKICEYEGGEDFDASESGKWARAACMYNAAILVKPPLQKGPLQISRDATSTLEIRPLIQRALSDKAPDLMKDFVLSENKVVMFKDGISSDPYFSPDDHVIYTFNGNVSNLATKVGDEKWGKQHPINIGVKTTNVVPHCDSYWTKEGESGAWLTNSPGTLSLSMPNIEKKDYILELDATPLVNNKYPYQKFRFFINGKDQGIYTLSKPGQQKVGLFLPKNTLIVGRNKFKFEALNPIAPKKIGAWESTGPLCFFLQSFQVIDADKMACKLDTTITNIVSYCDQNWLLGGESGAWLTNSPGTLSLYFSDLKNTEYYIQVDVNPLVNAKHPEQKFRFFVNDMDLGTVILSKPGQQKVELSIPNNVLAVGRNQFRFEPLTPVSPKEIGAWNHPGPLSFFLRSFQLHESKN